MKPPLSKTLLWLLGISLGAVLAVLCIPQTGWIVRHDVMGIVEPVRKPNFFPQPNKDLLARYPGDVSLRIWKIWNLHDVYSPLYGYHFAQLVAFERLEQKFPNSPAVFANEIGLSCMAGGLYVEWRPQEQAMWGVPAKYINTGPSPDSIHERNVNDVIYAALHGEQIDPGNAYFPTMAAIGYFSKHQDDLAIASLLRAGSDNSWKDYIDTNIVGGWRTITLANGGINGCERADVAYAQLLPQYAKINGVFRMADWYAANLQTSHRPADSIKLRHALLHIAAEMRAQSGPGIGALVGVGEMNLIYRNSPSTSSEKTIKIGSWYLAPVMDEQLISSYKKYLISQGDPQEAEWIAANEADGNRVVNIIAQEDSPSLHKLSKIMDIDGAAVFGQWIALSWFICVVLAWCSARAIIELAWVRQNGKTGQVSSAQLMPYFLIMIFSVIIAVAVCCTGGAPSSFLLAGAALDPVPTGSASFLSDRSFIQNVVCFLPLYTGLILVILYALINRRQGAGKLANAVAKGTLPLLCFLMPAFCVLTVIQAREDLRVSRQMIPMLAMGQGPYYAQLKGEPWPTADVRIGNADL
jgi:hypothetical protein